MGKDGNKRILLFFFYNEFLFLFSFRFRPTALQGFRFFFRYIPSYLKSSSQYFSRESKRCYLVYIGLRWFSRHLKRSRSKDLDAQWLPLVPHGKALSASANLEQLLGQIGRNLGTSWANEFGVIAVYSNLFRKLWSSVVVSRAEGHITLHCLALSARHLLLRLPPMIFKLFFLFLVLFLYW